MSGLLRFLVGAPLVVLMALPRRRPSAPPAPSVVRTGPPIPPPPPRRQFPDRPYRAGS